MRIKRSKMRKALSDDEDADIDDILASDTLTNVMPNVQNLNVVNDITSDTNAKNSNININIPNADANGSVPSDLPNLDGLDESSHVEHVVETPKAAEEESPDLVPSRDNGVDLGELDDLDESDFKSKFLNKDANNENNKETKKDLGNEEFLVVQDATDDKDVMAEWEAALNEADAAPPRKSR